ncbi:MAG: hypothetical protein ACM3NQ_11530 [Bacteroidales bacterium]
MISGSAFRSMRQPAILLALLGLFVPGIPTQMTASADQALTVSVDDPRPLARAVQALEERHGWVITYEDPPYVDRQEIADVTASVRKDRSSQPKVLIPRGGPFAFTYSVSGRGEPDELPVLRGLLEAYASTGYAGVFALVQTGTAFHVVPAMSRNSSGVLETRQSMLDAKISLADEDRTVYGMLEAITGAVSLSTGIKLWTGTVPLNLFGQLHVRGGASNETARTVLLRTLASTGRKFSWRLLRGPQPSGWNVLNVHAVPVVLKQ